MTILQSKTSQQGDSDDAPPKKKLKKSKNSIRCPNQSLAVNHPTSSLPGPSHRRTEQRDLYSYSPFYPVAEAAPARPFETDHVILKFQLDNFDFAIPPSHGASAQPQTHPQLDAGPSHLDKTRLHNPLSLEYYIYGPGSRSAHSKTATGARASKRALPHDDADAIQVISSEDIVDEPATIQEPVAPADGCGSLLDDIYNFDIDGKLEKFQQDALWEDSRLNSLENPLNDVESSFVQPMNGYEKDRSTEVGFGMRQLPRSSPVASLNNLGNTCFLNSVLYTLRFAPNFLHNLHHLVTDMNLTTSPVSNAKHRTASLGRNLTMMSMKKKEVRSGAGDLTMPSKSKKQIVTEKLHGVYEDMRAAETREHADPLHPDIFLTALREVNPIFEGNQQQDAHEFLVCLLDIFRETCESTRHARITRPIDDVVPSSNSESKVFSLMRNALLLNKTKSSLERKNKKNSAHTAPIVNRRLDRPDEAITPAGEDSEIASCMPLPLRVDNFVVQDFEGTMVLRTTCLECENTTTKEEPFADICVPIKTEYNDDSDEDSLGHVAAANPSELYQRAVVTDEFLSEHNKYYCEECKRYNEARRSVSYRRLPRLLTLQLKRFSSTFGAMSKVTKFMPTPMTLACFCEDCIIARKDTGIARHSYELYGVIMHLGPNMAGGHYIAYVRMTDSAHTYGQCTRPAPSPSAATTTNISKPSKSILNMFRTGSAGDALDGLSPPPRPPPPIPLCPASECCGVRLPETEVDGFGKYEPERERRWIACDDDIVKVLSASEVETLLSKNSTSNATPYLLFYVRKTD